jgi:hypothetical protein
MSIGSNLVEWLEQRLTARRAVLERLETGRLMSREKVCGRPWVDTTRRDIERYKQRISKYERLIAQVQAERQI